MSKLADEILKSYKANWEKFYVVAVTGSVAVGKTTIANQLAQDLSQAFPELTTAVISVDAFIFSNQELHDRGLFDKKGFPDSYDLQGLHAAISQLRAGSQNILIPKYSLAANDIAKGEFEKITRPKILIIEGVTALQVRDYDISVYVDADEKLIYQWFLKRTLAFIQAAKNDPASFYYQLSKMPIPQLMPLIEQTWQQTNLKNLKEFIEPTKAQADIIVHKTSKHKTDSIMIR
ncbi:type I pantothenate kinase [Oenococcus sicerae]|uniref:Type I pantothenate kinase n=1 Tax=Oenococcus sicerae TaxID=2203724 RepID=A0AAJ1VP69_9LACO|nr:type I pantothenate kinase [Oenococcus sicerae]MDN6900534.1 type I pantothenate kinase [Oenococcus sicerae]